MPIRKGDGSALAPKGMAELRKGDGTVLWSAGSETGFPNTTIQQNSDNYWYFEEGSGYDVADDNGSLDVTFTAIESWGSGSGAYDTFAVLDGNNDQANLGSNSQQLFSHFVRHGEGTIGMWINPDSTLDRNLISSGVVGGEQGFRFRDANGDVEMRVYNGSGDVFNIRGSSLTSGSWQSVVATADGSTARLLINGSEVATDSVSGTTASDLTNSVIMAGSNGQNTARFDGGYDNVFHHSEGFTVSEIQNWHDAWAPYYGLGSSSGTDPNTIYNTITLSTGNPYALTLLSEDYAVATGEGLSMIDISSPESPTEAATLSDSVVQSTYGVAVDGDYAYLADYDAMIRVADISDPLNPTVVDSLSIQTQPRKTWIEGNHLFVTTDGTASGQDPMFYSIDISSPTSISMADSLTGPDFDYSFELAVIDDTAIVCVRGAQQLTMVDVSDPTALSVSSTWTDSDLNYPYGIAIDQSESEAYVTCVESDDHVIAVDINDPTSPSKLGVFGSSDTDHPYGIALYNNGDTVVVAARNSADVTTIDVSDPTNMSQVGSVDTNGPTYGPYDTVVSGDYAFTSIRGPDEVVVSGTQ